jgi:FtsH-binding integral membrane protein
MLTLKKSLTLFLIFSHLNAFVLGGVSNVYAANQVVDTTPPSCDVPMTFELLSIAP